MLQLSRHNILRLSAVGIAMLLIVSTQAEADGLQPLETFIANARRQNPDDREAEASAAQSAAQSDASRASYLPSLTVQGAFAHNQYEAKFSLSPTETAVIQPSNQLDAYITLAAPLINVGAWKQHRVSELNARAAAMSAVTTQISVEENVTQAYYQLLGAEAVSFAAQKSLEYAKNNLKTVSDRHELGSASDLDLERAIASSAQSAQDRANAEQNVVNARRRLESLTRISPQPATRENYAEDDLHEESPLDQWMGDTDSLAAVQPAHVRSLSAEASLDAANSAFIPIVTAQAQEHLTNASGFTGHDDFYTLTATASWRLDFGLMPNVRAQHAAVNVAKAREDGARRAAEDAIYQAWNQVHLGVAKARAAREQLKAATLAQDIARDRYANGVALQLEVIQAQRDFFQAAISQVQADFDLKYARALLRLSSRRK